MTDRSFLVLEEIDVLLAESRELASVGPHFKIVHRSRDAGWGCLPGEDVVAAYLSYRARDYQLQFSTTTTLLFDFLARHRRIAQTASEIERSIRSDAFCIAQRRRIQRPKALPHRTSIKMHVKRIRVALASAFKDAGFLLDPADVLISQVTNGNQVAYQLRATIAWQHVALRHC